ncbi:MAG: hypothetical protein WAW88_04050 [Nocardioides sp.]
MQEQANEQERASSAGTIAGSGSQSRPASGGLDDVLRSAGGRGEELYQFLDTLGNIWNTQWYKGEIVEPWEDIVTGGHYWGAAMKGLGLGLAMTDFGNAMESGDAAGMAKAGFDAGATFATAPISLLWSGLSAEVGFFLPLNAAEADEHYRWAESRFSPTELVERYEAVQGFINYGNDNVERHAPWLNRAADQLMEKPADWLYKHGVRL